MPTITALAPNNAHTAMPAFVLTVNGTNFNSNATINWNGTAQTTTYVSADPAHGDDSSRGHRNAGYSCGYRDESRHCRRHIRRRHFGGNSNSMTFTIN